MDENNVVTTIETANEEGINGIYTSGYLMTEKLFYDFNCVTYNKLKKLYFWILCLLIFMAVINIPVNNYEVVIGSSFFIAIMTLLHYFLTKKSIKTSYKQRLIANGGKESEFYLELFEEKIVSAVDEVKRDFFYYQITKFFETKNFLLLILQHKVCILIDKNNLNASVDEVKSFLIQKCSSVKKKKFIDCSNDQKLCLVFSIAIITVWIAATAISIICAL